MDNPQAIGWLCENIGLIAGRAAGRPGAEQELAALAAGARAGQGIAADAGQLRKDLQLPAVDLGLAHPPASLTPPLGLAITRLVRKGA